MNDAGHSYSGHSVTTPKSPSALEDAVRLAMVPGVGPLLRKALLEKFGDAAAVFAATKSDLRETPKIGPKLADSILSAKELDVAGQIAFCAANGVNLIVHGAENYPRALAEIHDPPGVLFVRGDVRPTDALSIAIVGSRHATRYGLAQAERLAGSLARAGFTIISGLARGIDGAAHRGALAAGGRTIGVLGSGVLNIYPPEHVELARDVIASGAILSETPPESPPVSGAFPQRNRIITGMSLGVIVVEASKHSGALISARHAMEQGRDVFAVPGQVDNRLAQGCHQLIRDGAKLVETAEDVLEELGPLVAPAASIAGETVHHPAELLLNDAERQVLATIASEPISIDQLLAACGLSTPQALATLSVLEMRRLVRRLPGNRVARP